MTVESPSEAITFIENALAVPAGRVAPSPPSHTVVDAIGAQVVDYIQRECFDHLDAPVIRVHQADVPMPYAKGLEKLAKPDLQKTIAAVRKVMYLD